MSKYMPESPQLVQESIAPGGQQWGANLRDFEMHSSQKFPVRWIRFSWTQDCEIISDPGGPEDDQGRGW